MGGGGVGRCNILRVVLMMCFWLSLFSPAAASRAVGIRAVWGRSCGGPHCAKGHGQGLAGTSPERSTAVRHPPPWSREHGPCRRAINGGYGPQTIAWWRMPLPRGGEGAGMRWNGRDLRGSPMGG